LLAFARFPAGPDEEPDDFPPFEEAPALGDTVLRTTVVFENLRERLGSDGPNSIDGSNRADLIDARAGDDRVRARDGDDRVLGGEDDDRVNGNKNSDFIDGGPGDDDLEGGKSLDRIRGGLGDDRVVGNRGSDRLDGGPGDDDIQGSEEDDDVPDSKDGDQLEGGSGNDELRGGPGADSFVYDRFSASNEVALSDGSIGRDQILDFEPGEDKIVLANFDFTFNFDGGVAYTGLFAFPDLLISLSPDGRDSVIDLSAAFGSDPGNETITVIGVNVLVNSDFDFQ
jgi:Ca2+-binding RTX toxin-like protein